nr:immunoglobulin light chain junction region [Homo sapiens]
CQQSYSTPP